MLLRCVSQDDRDLLRSHSPIVLGENTVYLQRPDETANRFFREPEWLAYVHVDGYPNSQWTEDEIKVNLRGFCNVAEVDPACLTNYNFGPLRLLLEVYDHRDIPRDVWITEPRRGGRAGTVARVLPIRVWHRAYQLRADGTLARFFGPPPPPPAGPQLGPEGPFDRGFKFCSEQLIKSWLWLIISFSSVGRSVSVLGPPLPAMKTKIIIFDFQK
jgi:hypothetical protein